MVMAGWNSRYDKDGQSNFDKLAGRQLHVQDNYWKAAKVVLIIFVGYLAYIILSGSVGINGVMRFLEYLR
jgi:hypothetical protein